MIVFNVFVYLRSALVVPVQTYWPYVWPPVLCHNILHPYHLWKYRIRAREEINNQEILCGHLPLGSHR